MASVFVRVGEIQWSMFRGDQGSVRADGESAQGAVVLRSKLTLA